MNAFDNAAWRKSSYSHGGSGDCVELAALPDVIGIRDSKNPAAGHLRVGRRHLAALLAEVKSGRHDL
ncbi:DUF397 domain-containing protein [Thermomonospora amylolytica]|uniref:DUF397 domain-containing protein n=1 Tax=Thermomonospora amylolytica TaxID=1411117 RepID=UPI000E6BEDC5|nr:DUF397 domain-containing protein [Thermomonospora amylolytica]